MGVFFYAHFLSPKKGKLHHEENHITPDCPQWSRCRALCRRHDPDGLVRLRKHPVPDCRSPLPARRAGTLAHDRPHAWLPDREPVFDRLRARYHCRHGGDASCLPSYAVHQKNVGAAAADDPLQHADGRRDALGRFDARERVLEGTCGIRRGGWRGRGRCLIHPRHSALSVYPQNEAHRQASWPRMIAKSGGV